MVRTFSASMQGPCTNQLSKDASTSANCFAPETVGQVFWHERLEQYVLVAGERLWLTLVVVVTTLGLVGSVPTSRRFSTSSPAGAALRARPFFLGRWC